MNIYDISKGFPKAAINRKAKEKINLSIDKTKRLDLTKNKR